ncbi:MAG: chromate transporter [Proteobacteria bacterium]|nr:chromate transporter [Pseudomonadota bacterium]HQR04585.1 chromate transporter [Rhodocyclaceae bacterium]
MTSPTLPQLYLAFQAISLRAFGGALPWARRELVDRRRWLADGEFADLLALCQFLPGPNIGNLSILVGHRFGGAAGALAAMLGLLMVPVAIIIGLGILYDRYGELPMLARALSGIAAVAAGLIADMALRLGRPLWQRQALPGQRTRHLASTTMLLATFVAVGILRLPLLPVMAVLAPLSILLVRPQ